MTIVLDTEDLGVAAAEFRTLWPNFRVQPHGDSGVTRTRVERTFVGSIRIDEVEFGYDAGFRFQPTDHLQLLCVRSGVIDHERADGERIRFGPGQAGAFGAADGVSFGGSICKAHYHLISLSGQALADVSAGGAPVQLTSVAPVSEAANRQLVRVADYVCGTASAGAVVADSPLITGAVERLVAATVLAALPNSAELEPVLGNRATGLPALLLRAIDFIEEHAQSDITLDDIAGAVYVTPRALQYMFRKHRDCTPMEYLRNVRLDQAHRELRSGDRSAMTVGEVARRWGFGHLGRFATNYRMAFGESPHETLKS